MAWPVTIPAVPHVVLANAAVPACLLAGLAGAPPAPDSEGLARVDIALSDDRIAGIAAPGMQPAPADAARVDLAGAQAWPCFVDMHAGLDGRLTVC